MKHSFKADRAGPCEINTNLSRWYSKGMKLLTPIASNPQVGTMASKTSSSSFKPDMYSGTGESVRPKPLFCQNTYADFYSSTVIYYYCNVVLEKRKFCKQNMRLF
jgi:hypothetical protein